MRTPRESLVLAGILGYLETREDCYVWRNNTGVARMGARRFVRFSTPGAADILGVIVHRPTLIGQFLAVEVKRPGGKLSPHQAAWGERVRRHGGVYIVATCVDDVRAALESR